MDFGGWWMHETSCYAISISGWPDIHGQGRNRTHARLERGCAVPVSSNAPTSSVQPGCAGADSLSQMEQGTCLVQFLSPSTLSMCSILPCNTEFGSGSSGGALLLLFSLAPPLPGLQSVFVIVLISNPQGRQEKSRRTGHARHVYHVTSHTSPASCAISPCLDPTTCCIKGKDHPPLRTFSSLFPHLQPNSVRAIFALRSAHTFSPPLPALLVTLVQAPSPLSLYINCIYSSLLPRCTISCIFLPSSSIQGTIQSHLHVLSARSSSHFLPSALEPPPMLPMFSPAFVYVLDPSMHKHVILTTAQDSKASPMIQSGCHISRAMSNTKGNLTIIDVNPSETILFSADRVPF
ncbi:hypothetical protein B0O80DRAFT_273946 [Mortierella sp. GBAus27b]|nr:hypothetical protein B0O80DRAFT_273946 [Mortierella sp. GBAus27b]